jgi:hypothetical protein
MRAETALPAFTAEPPFPKLLARPRPGRTIVALLVATLAVGALALPALGRMSDRGTGVIEFELAGSSSHARQILDDWGEKGRDAATESLVLDYPFLVLYGLLYAALCMAVAQRARRRGHDRLHRAGVAIAWLALGAAVADAAENVALLVVASDNSDQPWPRLAATFASIKFALIFLALGYVVVGWVMARPAMSRRSPNSN